MDRLRVGLDAVVEDRQPEVPVRPGTDPDRREAGDEQVVDVAGDVDDPRHACLAPPADVGDVLLGLRVRAPSGPSGAVCGGIITRLRSAIVPIVIGDSRVG